MGAAMTAAYLKRAAYHEAGHVVMNWLVGARTTEAGINERGGGSVSVTYPRRNQYLQRWASILAGSRAERLVWQEDGESFQKCSDTDRKDERSLLKEMRADGWFENETAQDVKRARVKVIEIVDMLLTAFRSHVEVVAGALLRRTGEEITGAELDAMLIPAVSVPIEWKEAA
jgi:hypothetical protein